MKSDIPLTWRYEGVFRQTYAFLQKSQWWSRSKLEEYQWQRLGRLLHHAYENVPYYRVVFDERGLKPTDIRGLSDFQKLPFLTKGLIREYYDELVARNVPAGKTTTFSTSGSTGSPLTFLGEKTLYQVEAAFISRAYSAHNSRLHDEKSVWLRSYVPEGNAPIYRHEPELKRLYLSPFHLSLSRVKEYIELIDSYGAKLLVGYPSSLYILATLLGESGLRLKNIQVAHAASEKLLGYWKKKIEDVLGVPVKDHYGMVEKVSLFHRCSQSDLYHENLEYGVTEIVNQSQGVGEVVGTSLFNYAMPLIRYKMADTARVNLGNQSCACGRGLPLTVEEFEGRRDDILVTPGGRYIPGVNFYTMMYQIEGVRMFKIIQRSVDDVELQIVPDDKYDVGSEALVRKGMFERMGDISLGICLVDEILRSKETGKIQCVETRLSPLGGMQN